VLTSLKKIKICTHYELNGSKIDYFPSHIKDLEKIKPVYTELDGWTEDLRNVKSFKDLPRNAKAYVEAVE